MSPRDFRAADLDHNRSVLVELRFAGLRIIIALYSVEGLDEMRAAGTSEAASTRPSLPPQGGHHPSIDDLVFEVTKLFDLARGDDTVWATAEAVGYLYRNACRTKLPRPSLEQRDLMVGAITNARPLILRHLTEEFLDETSVNFGLDAAQGLAMLWAETDAQRAARHPHVELDLSDHAKRFRNELRNIDMLRAIEERGLQRLRDDVTKLRPLFDEYCA